MKQRILLFALFILFIAQKTNAQTCSLVCPSTVVVSNALHQCGATVNYPAPTLSGIVLALQLLPLLHQVVSFQ